uniref:SRCR domain-containing protein n=1 Tax=Oreochromis aureus TaxID=47969 RepID=A0A668S800_OREAU
LNPCEIFTFWILCDISLPDGQIRLTGSSKSCSGRGEIYYSGSWGTVCDDDWNIHDAQVVCRQLGCGAAVEATSSAHFGQGRKEQGVKWAFTDLQSVFAGWYG